MTKSHIHSRKKFLGKLGMEGIYINLIKNITKKATANINHNGERLNVFPLRLGTRQGCQLSSLLFNIVREVRGTPIRKEKEIKGIADYVIVHVENLKEPKNKQKTKNLLGLKSEFNKVGGYKLTPSKEFLDLTPKA